MSTKRSKPSAAVWDRIRIKPRESRDVHINVGESYLGSRLSIPMHVRRGRKAGPTVFVTAALHGDELNGTGVIREIIRDESIQLLRGTMILVPVLNVLGFERHVRYLPDRRDLNRCFPGSADGSLTRRMAHAIFQEIVGRSDYGIDLHTAAIRRTNFPHIRANMSDPAVANLAQAFGSLFLFEGKGPDGSLRRSATDGGCPTIVFEAGEAWKVEPSITISGVRGIKNVLIHLGMLEGTPEAPTEQIVIRHSKWVRAERGGFLEFHVRPGSVVPAGAPLTTNTSLLGKEKHVLLAPFDGIVTAMTTLPAVSPGEPVCHIGKLTDFERQRKLIRSHMKVDDLHGQLIDDLATNLVVVKKPPS